MKGIGTKNRQFQSGRAANKIAQQMSAARDAAAENEPESEETRRTKEIMAEFREKRGLTLMEQHLENQKIGQKTSSSSAAAKRKAFDRDSVSSIVIYLCPCC